MDKTLLLSIPIIIIAILAGVLGMVIRKIVKANTVVKLKKSEIEWAEIKCPKCQQVMERGLSLAGRGIIWSEKDGKKPGTLATSIAALDNTLSINIPPALNVSWRCSRCKLIILDHSKLVKVKKA